MNSQYLVLRSYNSIHIQHGLFDSLAEADAKALAIHEIAMKRRHAVSRGAYPVTRVYFLLSEDKRRLS